MPREIVDRNIKKASEKGQEDFIEKFYEVGVLLKYSNRCLRYPLLSRLGNTSIW